MDADHAQDIVALRKESVDRNEPVSYTHLNFFINWDPKAAEQNPALEQSLKELYKGGNLVFLKMCIRDRYMPSEKEKLTLVRVWPVSMTVRNHLFPFRTQKLSSLVPKIVRCV